MAILALAGRFRSGIMLNLPKGIVAAVFSLSLYTASAIGAGGSGSVIQDIVTFRSDQISFREGEVDGTVYDYISMHHGDVFRDTSLGASPKLVEN
jgi:hypothetical protein